VKPQKKLLLAVTVLLVAASFTLSRPAVGTSDSDMSGTSAGVIKLLGRS